MLCKLYGAMQCGGTRYVWDYVADEPVDEKEMPFGSERHKASEIRKAELMRAEVQRQGGSGNG